MLEHPAVFVCQNPGKKTQTIFIFILFYFLNKFEKKKKNTKFGRVATAGML
jgi:hypothetical protein